MDTPFNVVKLFCDASYDVRTKVAGVAVLLRFSRGAGWIDQKFIRHRLYVNDSNTAEVIATEIAIGLAKSIPLAGCALYLHSDSTSALGRAQEWFDWRSYRLRSFITVHIPGHRGHLDAMSAINTWCDLEARREMRRVRDLIQYPHLVSEQ